MWLKFRGLSVVIYSSSTAAAADEGLTREVHGLQPWCLLGVLPAGSQGQGNFPAVWAAPGHDHISHNEQKHFHHLPPTPQPPPTLPSLSTSFLCSLLPLPPCSLYVSHSFPSPPLSLPSGDTPTQWSKPVPLDLWCSSISCPGSGGWHSAQLMLLSGVYFWGVFSKKNTYI